VATGDHFAGDQDACANADEYFISAVRVLCQKCGANGVARRHRSQTVTAYYLA
jgi:hypothetical protein